MNVVKNNVNVMATHETLVEHRELKNPSDRSFGIVFFGFFLIVCFFPLLKGHSIRWWALPISFVFITLAFVYPSVLNPLNRAWMKFGAFMQKIVSPVIMGVVYYLLITPLGVSFRLMGKDLLKVKFDKNKDSYWVVRSPVGPKSDSMRQQF